MWPSPLSRSWDPTSRTSTLKGTDASVDEVLELLRRRGRQHLRARPPGVNVHRDERARRQGGLVVTVSLVALLSSACSGPSGVVLREGARSLVPDNSQIVAEIAADCVELEPSPSCVHIYFVMLATPGSVRASAVRRAATRSGWTVSDEEVLSGGVTLSLQRDELQAVVYLWTGDRAAACEREPKRSCADVVMVEGEG
jgi:hypothetical protein